MEYEILKPSSVLEPYIRYYWGLDIEAPIVASPYRVIPQGCIECMFFHKSPYRMMNEHTGAQDTLPLAIISGQHNSWFDMQATGHIGIFSVLFKPHAARMFFPLPAKELVNKHISLRDLWGKHEDCIEEKMISANTNIARKTIIEKFLTKKLCDKSQIHFTRLSSSIDYLLTKQTDISVDQLAYRACLSHKQFGRLFSQYVGMNPKQYLRIVRFQYVLNTKQTTPDIPLTTLALQCGYYDQAHFIREFKEMSGLTPRQYFSQGEAYSDFFQ